MKKIIKRYGNSLVITISTEEALTHGVKEDDMVDIKMVKIKGLKA